MTQIFTLPWPPKACSPNANAHKMALYRAKKAYRAACGWAAKCQNAKPAPAGLLTVQLTFNPPHRRGYDQDNLVASMKAGLDGLADALGVDDNVFRLAAPIVTDQVAGTVVVSVGPAA